MEKEIPISEWEQRAAKSSHITPSATSVLAIMKNSDDNIAPTTVSESRSDIEYCPTAQPTADDDALYHHKSGRHAIRDGDAPTNIAIVSSSQEQSPHPASDTLITTNSSDCKQQLTDGTNNMNITSSTEEVDVCACCGKEGSDLNICNTCKVAKYCNAACKKKHRSKHKKKCERRVAELYDIELFKQPPLKKEDCPICFLPLPSLDTGSKYYSCCGKKVCSGCVLAPIYDNLGNIIGTGKNKCPFCRTPGSTSNDEELKRIKNRAEVGDANAVYILGSFYSEGSFGLAQDGTKAFELWHRAGELGYAGAYFNIGSGYLNGRGVERDEKKANHYFELAAMGGIAPARHNLGCSECLVGNWDRAVKHYMIAAGDGLNDSVKIIHQLYKNGQATKDDYAKSLLTYQKCMDEIRSDQRDKAAAFSDGFKYH